MALLKKNDKNINTQGLDIEEELEDSIGSKIFLAVITVLIFLIWLGIVVILIKYDAGGFGSTVLRPIIKDVPYLNMILPDDPTVDNTEYQYETLDDAVDRIKELEALLDASLATNATDADKIAELNKLIAALEVYKQNQEEYEKIKEKFDKEVVFSDQAPDIEEYKTFYESIDPENAEVLYKQVVEQLQYDAKVEEYVKTYSSMKPKEAAAIFDTMTDDLQLVADILENMDAQSRADIMGKMNSEVAAKVTAIMNPPIN